MSAWRASCFTSEFDAPPGIRGVSHIASYGLDRRAIPSGMRFSQWKAADGWSLRRFDWPVDSAQGSLLFLGGRGDFAEKYLEALAHWHGRGWSVAGFDWRGQGGSGRFLADPLICHIPDFDLLLADLRTLVEQWRDATPGPHVIVAHSMGAHLALRMMADRAVALDRLVLCAPMIGISAGPLPGSVAGLAARAAVMAGLGERPIWRGDIGNVGGRMTSCPDRQQDKLWWKAATPEIASGPPSWGWLAAAGASIRRLPRSRLARIACPTLMLASRRDPVIDLAAARRAAAAMPAARLLLFEGTGHELLREADGVRLAVLAAIDGFLAADGVPARLS